MWIVSRSTLQRVTAVAKGAVSCLNLSIDGCIGVDPGTLKREKLNVVAVAVTGEPIDGEAIAEMTDSCPESANGCCVGCCCARQDTCRVAWTGGGSSSWVLRAFEACR